MEGGREGGRGSSVDFCLFAYEEGRKGGRRIKTKALQRDKAIKAATNEKGRGEVRRRHDNKTTLKDKKINSNSGILIYMKKKHQQQHQQQQRQRDQRL